MRRQYLYTFPERKCFIPRQSNQEKPQNGKYRKSRSLCQRSQSSQSGVWAPRSEQAVTHRGANRGLRSCGFRVISNSFQ
jgi:hypothetical protein